MTPGEIFQQYKALIVTVAGLSIAAVVILIGATIWQRAGKVTFELTVVPGDALVKMNATPVAAGTLYVKPGTYEVTATKEGFADYKKSITIDEAAKNTLGIPLVPLTTEATNWVKQNKRQYETITSTIATNASSKQTLLKERNPITANMPFKNLLYGLNYRADPADTTDSKIIIDITTSQANRQSALFQIRQWGYDPTDYKIEFSEYVNPLL